MHMTTQAIKVYNILKNKFSAQEAEEIVGYFETLPKEGLATKEDLYVVKNDVHIVRNDVHALRTDLAQLETRLIKWVVGTGLVVVSVIIATLKYIK